MGRHLAIDLDDVCLDLTGGILAAVNQEYGVRVELDDLTQWDLRPVLNPIIGRPWMKWLRERDLWATFPAIEGAIGSLYRLRREGNYLECVTSKPEWAEGNVWRWLGAWRPPFNRVTIMDEVPKVSVTDAELLIDDKPQNCIEFLEAGRQAILFARPHNRGAQLPRIDGWTAVLKELEKA